MDEPFPALPFFIFISLLICSSVRTSRIELEIPSISPPYTFELSSNSSQLLDREVLLGLVDGTSSSIPSSVLVRASYDHLRVERSFNFYQPNDKQVDQPIKKEPIFRSYLLTPSFNRSYPFLRVLVASARGAYEDAHIAPVCAIVTAVNEQNLYETQACLISPETGYCLTTISVLKMVEQKAKNHTTNKIELYLKLHHVTSSKDCVLDHLTQQDHIHHEVRIGHAEFLDYDHLFISTLSRSSLSIDYPNSVHYPGWFIPLKSKLILSSVSSLGSSLVVRCQFPSILSVYSVQTNVLQLLNHYIQIDYRQSASAIDFHLTINQGNANNAFEIDLATVMFTINGTSLPNSDPMPSNSIFSVDWFLLSSSASNESDPQIRVPIQIQLDDIQTIVALTDYTRLINTAMLSMRIEQYPLKILAVNHSGNIQSISQAVCHSENIHLIQVDSTCSHIYFSGHERDDFFDHVNSPTSIVIRYEKYLQRLHFTIYIPERPLRIELSDAKLSRINGWFVTSRDENPADDDEVDEKQTGLERHDDELDDDDDDEDDDDDVKCYPVYQQATIHVYTKFYRTTQNGDRIYLFNKLNVLVTPLVRTHLETDNTRIAMVKDGRLIGIGPGKTNVRIYSFANKLPMGSKTVHVDDQELIRVENISLNVLTDIQLQTQLVEHIDPVYKIQVRAKPLFNQLNIDNKNQFGQLNVVLTYSDGNSMSLDEIPMDYYQLDISMSRTSPSAIHFDSSLSWKHVQIRPLALGRTSLHGRLKLGQQQCTDDRTFSQNDLSCQILVLSNEVQQLSPNVSSSSDPPSDHYVILNHGNAPNEHRIRTSPFLLILSILLGACMVLVLAFLLRYFINVHSRRKSTDQQRRHRHATHSGAEEANHDWIFLDRSSLEMPMKEPAPTVPSIHSSTLHITSNPLVNSSTLQRQTGLAELSHSQMIAYFDNLKESHA